MQRQMEKLAERAPAAISREAQVHSLLAGIDTQEETLHVAYTVDSTVFDAVLRSMLTLGHHSVTSNLTIHLLVPPSDALAAEGLVRCFQQRLLGARPEARVPRVEIVQMWDMPFHVDYPYNKGLMGHHAAFGRLWLQEYLPEVARVVYLDTDTLIKGDLSPLFARALLHPLAASMDVISIGRMYGYFAPKVVEHLPADPIIFNSGVLVLDLARWRAENISASLAKWADELVGATSSDQLMLNLEFQARRGGFDVLPREWNTFRVSKTGWPDQGWCSEPSQAKLLHWTDQPKPWASDNKSRWLQVYRHLWSPTGFASDLGGGDCASFEL